MAMLSVARAFCTTPSNQQPSCFLIGFACVTSLTEVPTYWQSSVETWSIGPWSKLRGAARTSQARSSESPYSACLRLQRGLEVAKTIPQLPDGLLPVLLRHGRPRNLLVAWSCGCKRIFDRNPSK